MHLPLPFIALALFALSLVGCGPMTFVVGVSPGDQRLESTIVQEADGWTRDRVVVIDVTGMIMNAKTPGLLSAGENPVSTFREELDAAAADRRVKAIIVRLNTPGGAVTASDAMYRDVLRFKEQTGKPVVVLMMDVAASGGYYLACAGDEIVAYPTTVTGSIGVIIQTVSLQPALSRIGISTEALTSGPNKDAGSPFGEMTEEHRAVLQGLVDEFYTRFTQVVRESRPSIPADRFDEVTDGRVVSGDRALEVGLVDHLGDLDDAFGRAKALAGIDDANLVVFHRALDYVGSPYASTPGGLPQAGGSQINLLQLNLDGTLGGLASPSGFYYLWRPDVP
ncbi:MAG: signal peptide peptidase SppA [Phycisphaerales bacterium JB063]